MDCNAGRRQHERVPQKVSVTFDACQPVWDNMIERLYVTTEFPNPLPDQMTLKDSFMTSGLPMLLLFGGVVKREIGLRRPNPSRAPGRQKPSVSCRGLPSVGLRVCLQEDQELEPHYQSHHHKEWERFGVVVIGILLTRGLVSYRGAFPTNN